MTSDLNVLQRAIQEQGIDFLFNTDQGREFTAGAVRSLRSGARCAASTVRLPEIRDRIPSHIRTDILYQSYNLMEFAGRCSLILLFFEERDPEFDGSKELKQVFATIFTHACEAEDSLRRLCKLTIEHYTPKGIYPKRGKIDVDF